MNVDTVIDLTWLESATLEDLKSAMRNPSQLAAVNVLLQTPEGKAIASEMLNDPDYKPKPRQAAPTPEEAAQIAADTALAEQQAAEAAAAELAETARLAEEQRKAAEAANTPPVEEKKKIVIDYQVTAEDGTNLGRRTHIEGWAYEGPDGVIEKLKAAHINAVRYAERLKANRVTSVEARTQQSQAQEQVRKLEQEASTAVEEAVKDPAKLKDAIAKVTKADREAEMAREAVKAQGRVIANAWLADHKEDFQPCDANTKIIGEWLKNQDPPLELSYENLELAFKANETRLAKPVPQAPVEEAPAAVAANPPAAAPVAPPVPTPPIATPPVAAAEPVSTPVAPASQPAATAPESTPAVAPIAQPAARRPGVNGSLPPGSLSAQRPPAQQQPSTTTRAELLKEMKAMSSDKLRKMLKNTEYVSKLRAAGIPVASNV